MTIDPKDQITVSLPVAGVLTAAEIERSTISAVEQRVNDTAYACYKQLQVTAERIGNIAGGHDFDRTTWLAVTQQLYALAQDCTRAAVAISTSLAARDALIQQNTTRAPESAPEREG